MKSERLLRALGQVDEKYIDAAAPETQKQVKHKWFRWAAMAACFCIVIAAVVAVPGLLWRSGGSGDSAAEVAVVSEESIADDTENSDMMSTAQETKVAEAQELTDELEAAEPEESCAYPLRGFDEMLTEWEQDAAAAIENVAIYTQVSVGERTANYEMVYGMDGDRLADYVGVLHLDPADGYCWYYPVGKNNLKYLIRKNDHDEEWTLWIFRSFVVDDAGENAYTYGDVCREIYGMETAADIVSITAAPSTANNTDLGIQIQEEIGTTVYSDREDIEMFYSVIQNVLCYGESDWEDYYTTENQYTYSFSTDAEDKLTSGEEIYGTRYLTVTLEDGTTIDSWKYNALRGCFYEFGGVGTKALTAENVSLLNDIFGIE